jgi:phospholipid-binding lipoprotein MlaA
MAVAMVRSGCLALSRSRSVGIALTITVAPLLAGCMTTHAASIETAEADRWEGTNRRIYQFNKNLDRAVLKPLANGYRTVVPTAARHGITNVYSNYGEPANFLNSVLQGKISQAFRTLDRFLINSTLGVGGLADNATDLDRPQEKEDFGQTFAAWGMDSGPYVVLPVFGPSTLRDSFGLAADIVIDPADFARNAAFSPSIYWRIGQLATRIINFRARLTDQGGDGLLADSLDEYTLVRSVYLQSRRSALYDGNLPPDPDEELDEDPAPPAADPPPNPAPPAPQ